ncbi:MAG: hypothetical protein V2I82_10420 [Halieaceae bacterium]|nr:hypothetical protein [Halieaceae bacterium]
MNETRAGQAGLEAADRSGDPVMKLNRAAVAHLVAIKHLEWVNVAASE